MRRSIRRLMLTTRRAAIVAAGGLAVSLTATGARAETPAEPIIAQFPPDQETCYGRAYDAQHMRSRPRQAVEEIYLFRLLRPDVQLEEKPLSREEAAAEAIEWETSSRKNDVTINRTPASVAGTAILSVLVRFKGKPHVFSQSVECNRGKDGRFGCGVDCDGGNFGVRPDGTALVIEQEKNSTGLRVQSGCSSGDESAPDVRIDPADDGLAFRLEPMPAETCENARDRARPFWAMQGEPLRVSLARREHVCFANSGRGGSVAVETIRIETLGAVQDKGEDGFVLPVKLSVGLLGGRTVGVTSECVGDSYAFDCSVDRNGFRLRRSGHGGVTVEERYHVGGEIPKLLGLPETEKVGPFDLIEMDEGRCSTPR